uniref:Kinesin motor domain-containing protein n=1 Tax=Panagrellus redivivus TaxID=6233 RepID=A0A7E4W377_PANRE
MQDTNNGKDEVGYRLRARSKKVETCAVVEKLCAVSVVMRPASAHALIDGKTTDNTAEVIVEGTGFEEFAANSEGRFGGFEELASVGTEIKSDK